MSDKSLVPTTTQESVEAFAKRVMFGGVPRDTLTLTLLMCQRYGLDPLMKHVVVIQFGGKAAPYITRDGLLHVAHRSGQLDGMNVTYGVDDGDMWAECTVWRKDMTHPFIYRVYRSEYDSKRNVWNSHPRAMLAKTAEVFALRRAFDVDMTAIEEMDKAVHEGDGQIIEAEEAVRREAEIDPGKAADQPPAAPDTTVRKSWQDDGRMVLALRQKYNQAAREVLETLSLLTAQKAIKLSTPAADVEAAYAEYMARDPESPNEA